MLSASLDSPAVASIVVRLLTTAFCDNHSQPPQCIPCVVCIYNVYTILYIRHIYRLEKAMRAKTSKPDDARTGTINLRVSRGQKALIDRAAQALGRNRSDFMLETACREAEAVLLDRRYFALSEDEFKRFTALLDKPPASNPRLARLLKTKAPWDK